MSFLRRRKALLGSLLRRVLDQAPTSEDRVERERQRGEGPGRAPYVAAVCSALHAALLYGVEAIPDYLTLTSFSPDRDMHACLRSALALLPAAFWNCEECCLYILWPTRVQKDPQRLSSSS